MSESNGGFSKDTLKKLLASLFLIKSKPLVDIKNQWKKPLNYWMGLSTSEVDEESTGCTIEEPLIDDLKYSSLKSLYVNDSNGYKRVQCNYWGFDHENLTVFNTKDIIFPKPKKNWGSIASVIVFDQFTNGNILFYKNLDSAFEAEEEKQFYIKSGKLKISFPKDDCNGTPSI